MVSEEVGTLSVCAVVHVSGGTLSSRVEVTITTLSSTATCEKLILVKAKQPSYFLASVCQYYTISMSSLANKDYSTYIATSKFNLLY